MSSIELRQMDVVELGTELAQEVQGGTVVVEASLALALGILVGLAVGCVLILTRK